MNTSGNNVRLPVTPEEVSAGFGSGGDGGALHACSCRLMRTTASLQPRNHVNVNQCTTPTKQLEFFAEEEPITIIPSFQLRHNASGMLSCAGVRAERETKRAQRTVHLLHARRVYAPAARPPSNSSKPTTALCHTASAHIMHQHHPI